MDVEFSKRQVLLDSILLLAQHQRATLRWRDIQFLITSTGLTANKANVTIPAD